MGLFRHQINNQNPDFFPKIKDKNLLLKRTPFFYTDINIVLNRYHQLKKSLQKNWPGQNIIAFSFKTNYKIIKKLKKNANISAEVVSMTEYEMAKLLKFKKPQIIYNGPYKQNLLTAICQKISINLDNQTEICKLIKNKNKIKCKIGIRLNTNLKISRFGFNIENGNAKKAIEQLQKNQIKISGLHLHLGFYSPPSLYQKISHKIIDFIKENQLEVGYIDFGGGFPGHGLKPYGFKKYTIPQIDEYINQICSPLNSFFKNKNNKPTIIIEPGRFLADDSTVLITKVVHSQLTENKQIIFADATNQMLSSVWFRPQIIKPLNNSSDKKVNTIIYGSSCQEDDILYQGQLPILEDNSLVSFHCVGAYNQNMCNNFIFKKPKSYINKITPARKQEVKSY